MSSPLDNNRNRNLTRRRTRRRTRQIINSNGPLQRSQIRRRRVLTNWIANLPLQSSNDAQKNEIRQGQTFDNREILKRINALPPQITGNNRFAEYLLAELTIINRTHDYSLTNKQ
ncbi:1090_t:CDS:2 [Funneliformis caledonium]|uniref:1090_t:CDS:1 n=1 Tax=Funneliformis caledonium TaxID=1117310 RepID=A0A9N9H8M0_9GLOM|nr:1090_t:CDS:2 [Funneliformis caledonium]